MTTINNIYLQTKQKFIVDDIDLSESVNARTLATALKNIASLGYTLSPDLIATLSDSNINEVYGTIHQTLTQMLGSDKHWQPMYPNFPDQVMDMDDAELFLNAMFHYFGDELGLRILPEYVTEKRDTSITIHDLKLVDLGNMEDFVSMISSRMSAKTVFTPQEKEDFTFLMVHEYKVAELAIPSDFTNKENMCFIASMLLTNNKIDKANVVKFMNTATDVLRLTVGLSDGDISLAENTLFRKFKRSERRFILECLDQAGHNQPEDMLRHRGKWIRLGERLHPGDYSNRYAKAFNAFKVLRNAPKTIETFNSKLEALLSVSSPDAKQASDMLVSRPGEFARRLNQLLSFDQSDVILNNFNSVVDNIPDTLLIDILCYFENRLEVDPSNLRIFFPKGNLAHAKCVNDGRSILTESTINSVTSSIRTSLLSRYAAMDGLGKVYIAPEFSGYNIPFGTRSASKSLNPLSRGSKLDMNLEADTIRFFLWWKDLEDVDSYETRVDVDLSSVIYNSDWKYHTHVSYTNIKADKGIRAVHSGDITSAPKGACEFIDVDVASVVKNGGRYVLMNVYSYTGQKFTEMPECFAGFMSRKEPQKGGIFDPKTVEQKFDLSTNSTVSVPMILDCVERKVIWTDLAMKGDDCGYSYGGNNVESNLTGISLVGKAMAELKKPTMHDLFTLHAEARGMLVSTKEEADTIFSPENGIRPEDYPL